LDKEMDKEMDEEIRMGFQAVEGVGVFAHD
jgi:hypothetical protein